MTSSCREERAETVGEGHDYMKLRRVGLHRRNKPTPLPLATAKLKSRRIACSGVSFFNNALHTMRPWNLKLGPPVVRTASGVSSARDAVELLLIYPTICTPLSRTGLVTLTCESSVLSVSFRFRCS